MRNACSRIEEMFLSYVCAYAYYDSAIKSILSNHAVLHFPCPAWDKCVYSYFVQAKREETNNGYRIGFLLLIRHTQLIKSNSLPNFSQYRYTNKPKEQMIKVSKIHTRYITYANSLNNIYKYIEKEKHLKILYVEIKVYLREVKLILHS